MVRILLAGRFSLFLLRLRNYEIRGIDYYLLRTYILNHKQIVEITYNNKETNQIFTTLSGKANDSLPSALKVSLRITFIHYHIYINDLTRNIQLAKPTLYADDTNVILK